MECVGGSEVILISHTKHTSLKLPCGVIFSLNVSLNALFQFEIIFKIYE